MQKCINLIAHSGTYREVISEWMDDIKTEKFGAMVYHMQMELEANFEKLMPGVTDPALLKYVEVNIRNACMLLSQLHDSN